VEWRPCPRCDTELDPDSGICPACLYDPAKADAAVPDPTPQIPFLEQYAGTPFAEASTPPHRPLITLSRTRVLVAVALMAVAVLYGSLVMVSDTRAREDHPAAPLGLVLTR
jgi:hypothetical protein